VSAEPSDPLDKAAWLLEREPEFRQKLAELKVQMVYWEARLERVEAAKELLRQIGELWVPWPIPNRESAIFYD